MTRMPVTGASSASPNGSKEELQRALADLGVGDAFDLDAVGKLYSDLGRIKGRWGQERLEASKVSKELLAAAKYLSEVSRLLRGGETGLRTTLR